MSKKTLVLLALFLLILSGCQGIKFGKTKEQAAALTDYSHTGIKGVTINFVQNNPPDVVFTGTPMDAIIEVKNEGGTEASGAVYLSGYDSNIIPLEPRFQEFTALEPRTKFTTFGGYDQFEFTTGGNLVYLPQGTDVLPQNLLASVCYQYRTEARIPVCIDPNPTSILEAEACRVVNPSVSGGQGGPVSVTALKEDSAPGQTSFLITIANMGDGAVIEQSSIGSCPDDLQFNDVDIVKYSVILSGVEGTCKPDDKVRLSNKQGTIFCTFTLGDSASPAYTSVLEINLDYGYLSKREKAIRIKSIT